MIRYECELKEEKAENKMNEAKKLENVAKKIISNEKRIYNEAKEKGDNYIEECKSKARDEAMAEKKSMIDRLNDTIASLKAKIVSLKNEISSLLFRKSKLEKEVNYLDEIYNDKVQEASLIIERAEIRGEEIIQDAMDKKDCIGEYRNLQEVFGIVSAEKYYRVKKHLQETYNELNNLCGDSFTKMFPDVFDMNKDELSAFGKSEYKNYGREDVADKCELLAAICGAYEEIRDKPRIWKEEPEKIKADEKAKKHRLGRWDGKSSIVKS